MKNINETILLVSAIQGCLLFLGLITKKAANKLSNIAISLLIFVITIELFFSWGGATGYNNSSDAIPFWTLQSYLLIPAAFWIFLEGNTNPTFRLSKKHWLIFLPALIEIGIHALRKAMPQLLSNHLFLALIKSKLWFFFILKSYPY